MIKDFFMKKRSVFVLLMAVAATFMPVGAADWQQDVLGDGYVAKTISMSDDYRGKVVSTVVKKQDNPATGKAVLYVHGYNDYFFQRELGDSVVAHGYGFYAVDLRKYGRSLLDGQNRFEVKNMKEYFADIDSALSVMAREGYDKVVLMGHSTGGLTTSYYMTVHRADRSQVKALVLNSPFLDWNLSKFQEKFLVPFVSVLPFKKMKISQGMSRAYAESLLSKYHGEWDYNTDWKLEVSPSVTIGWISAIHKAQRFLKKKAGVEVPVLLMHSDKSVYGDTWTAEHNACDGVLDVKDISKYGKRLGADVTEVGVADGLHDLILSRKDVRESVYRTIFEWLSTKKID